MRDNDKFAELALLIDVRISANEMDIKHAQENKHYDRVLSLLYINEGLKIAKKLIKNNL